MPDIAKCLNNECPMKDTCWRWTSPPSDYRQSYSGFEPDEDGHCNAYWEDKK